ALVFLFGSPLIGRALGFLFGSLLLGRALGFLFGSLLLGRALGFLFGSLLFGRALGLFLRSLLFSGALGVDRIASGLVVGLAAVAAGHGSLGEKQACVLFTRNGVSGGILYRRYGRGRHRLNQHGRRQNRHRNGGKQSRSQIHIRFLAKRETTRAVWRSK
ncbi:MAG: hypothetical protein ACK4PN_08175, partial [Allorhizobium sp.]